MSTFLNNFFQADTAAMDPIFFSPSNGIPSESKLATYMNRQNVGTPTYGISSGFSRLNLDSPISIKKAQVTQQSPEFIPSRISSSPSFYSAYQQMLTNGNVGIIGNPGGTILTPTSGKNLNGLQAKLSAQVQQKQQQQQAHITGSGGGGGPSLVTVNQSATVTPTATQSFSMNTPLKGRNSLLRNDSPSSVGEKSPPRITPHNSPIPTTLPAVHQENVGGTIYFYPTASHTSGQNSSSIVNTETVVSHQQNVVGTTVSANSTILYGGHVYPGPASNVINFEPRTQLSNAFFMPDDMRAELQHRNEISNLILDTNSQQQPNDNPNQTTLQVDHYHSLYPLESQPTHSNLPSPSSTYKAIHVNTGVKFCLRRVHGFRPASLKCMAVVEMWKKLQHSNVVRLREVFTTKAFGDNSLVLVYDYHPGSQTLMSTYFTPAVETNGYTDPFPGEARPFSHKSNQQRTPNGPLLPETTIWAIIMQLTAGLRAIHQAGLACRQLDPTKIIVTGKRVRFSFLCVNDIVSFDPNPMAVVNMHQQEDLTQLGKLVLALACRGLQSVKRDNVQASIDLVTRQYSSDLRNFILYLFNTTQRRSVTDLMPMIGARFYTQLDALQSQCDMQEDELAKEMENGRLYRILVKLGCINERPDLNMDGTWSETGDRYMLKLFRDYLFHSVTEDGRPWLDHAHIVQCLNKLDAGVLEKVQLMSRDEQSVLVVTYAELKNCLENAFSELVASAPS